MQNYKYYWLSQHWSVLQKPTFCRTCLLENQQSSMAESADRSILAGGRPPVRTQQLNGGDC